jgi:hypothetical protein
MDALARGIQFVDDTPHEASFTVHVDGPLYFVLQPAQLTIVCLMVAMVVFILWIVTVFNPFGYTGDKNDLRV